MSAADRMLDLLLERECLRFGDFTLKSGRKSPYFINTGRLHRGGDLLAVGDCYAELIAARLGEVRVVFGPAYKGIPLALGAAAALEQRLGRAVDWCYDRKEAKDHGDGGAFVGAPLGAGTPVVIVDDVLTAGTALRESLAKLKPLGCRVLGLVVSVDRCELGQGQETAAAEIARESGVPVLSLLRMDHVLGRLAQYGHPAIPATGLAAIRAYIGLAAG